MLGGELGADQERRAERGDLGQGLVAGARRRRRPRERRRRDEDRGPQRLEAIDLPPDAERASRGRPGRRSCGPRRCAGRGRSRATASPRSPMNARTKRRPRVCTAARRCGRASSAPVACSRRHRRQHGTQTGRTSSRSRARPGRPGRRGGRGEQGRDQEHRDQGVVGVRLEDVGGVGEGGPAEGEGRGERAARRSGADAAAEQEEQGEGGEVEEDGRAVGGGQVVPGPRPGPDPPRRGRRRSS